MTRRAPGRVGRCGAALLCALCACTQALQARPPPLPGEWHFETVSQRETIPYGTVTRLLETAQGELWLGTQLGVLRYDGYRFRPLRGSSNDALLQGANITDFHTTPDGRVWISTGSIGVLVFDPRTQALTQFSVDGDAAHRLNDDRVNVLVGDGGDGVWIGTTRGLTHWQPGLLSNDNGLNNDEVRSLLLDRSGALWAGTRHGLLRRPHASAPFEVVVPDHSIFALFQASDDAVWIGTEVSGAARLDPGTLAAHWVVRPEGGEQAWAPVREFMESRPGQIWIATFGGGIVIVDGTSGRAQRELHADRTLLGGLGIDYLGALLSDRSGLLWVGTWGAGLQRHNPNADAFSSLRQGQRPGLLSYPDVYSLFEDHDGLLWVGLDGGGIDRVDRRRGVIDGFRANPDDPHALGDGTIAAITRSADGALWVGTYRHGLHRYRPQSRDFVRYTSDQGLVDNASRALLAGRDGALWIGTENGLSAFDPATERFTTFLDEDGQPLRSVVWMLLEDPRHQRLWVGTQNGLLVGRTDGDPQLRRVRAPTDGQGALSHQQVRGLLFDAEGRLLVSTSRGVDRLIDWDGRHGRFAPVLADIDLGRNLQMDRQGRLWSDRAMFDPASGRVTEYGRADGVDLGTNWVGTYTRTADGLLLFGGTQGVLAIDPDAYRPWTYKPPLLLQAPKIDGQEVALPEPGAVLELQPGQRTFSVEFAALDYSAPEKIRYRYRLDGFDRGWVEADADHRLASYGNLRPGLYQLHVQGSNRHGDFNADAQIMQLRVLPTLWQTPAFTLFMLLAALTLLYLAVRWRTARLRERATQLAAAIDQRTAELKASHGQLATTHTELQAAHAQLIGAQQQLVMHEKMAALGTLTAGVAHEINNPTNFADGAVQDLELQHRQLHAFLLNLAGTDADPDVLAAFALRFNKLDEMTATAREGHQRIKAIVGDLRQFTRLDQAERKPVPIAEPILSTLNLVRTRYDRIAFHLDLAYNPTIECQPAKLGQVFMNLIVNACEAIESSERPLHGVVSIASTAIDGAVELCFEDNGHGMDAATRERVFEPFFTTKGVGSGTGLGLSIVFGIIKDHSGSIRAESKAGEGSRFVLRLPIGSSD